MPLVATSQGMIAYATRGGAGPPFILIHGAGGSYRHWGAVIGALPAGSRRYALDLPGHGRSPLPGRRTIPEYATVVVAFMQALDIKRALVAGHSMGGAIALWLALEHPQLVAGLGLVASGARLPLPSWLLAGLRRTPHEAVERLVPLLYAGETIASGRHTSVRDLLGIPSQVLEGDYEACQQFDVLDRLATVQVPAAIVCGAIDQLTPPGLSRELSERLPYGVLSIIEGAGHMPQIEAPQQVALALSALLAAQSCA